MQPAARQSDCSSQQVKKNQNEWLQARPSLIKQDRLLKGRKRRQPRLLSLLQIIGSKSR